MRALVVETERAWQALGAVRYGPTAAEEKSLEFRRSLYVAEDLAGGRRPDPDQPARDPARLRPAAQVSRRAARLARALRR